MGAAFWNQVKIYWNFNLVCSFGHTLDDRTIAIEHELTTDSAVNIICAKEDDFDIRSEIPVYSPEETSTLFQANSTKTRLDPPP